MIKPHAEAVEARQEKEGHEHEIQEPATSRIVTVDFKDDSGREPQCESSA